MAELKECDVGLLETRLKNLTASIETMEDDGDIRATKKFMEHVRDYMAQLLDLLRRPAPEQQKREKGSHECDSMQRVEGGIPYCEAKQTACDGCPYDCNSVQRKTVLPGCLRPAREDSE